MPKTRRSLTSLEEIEEVRLRIVLLVDLLVVFVGDVQDCENSSRPHKPHLVDIRLSCQQINWQIDWPSEEDLLLSQVNVSLVRVDRIFWVSFGSHRNQRVWDILPSLPVLVVLPSFGYVVRVERET